MEARMLKSYAGLAIAVVITIAGLAPLVHLIAVVTVNGVKAIAKNFPGFFIEERALPGSEAIGGVGPYIVGTLILTAIASLIGIPISILAAVYATQSVRSRLGPLTSIFVRTMIEFPTIIIGLSVYGTLRLLDLALQVIGLHSPIPRFSALSGSIALAIIMIPFIYSQVEESLKGVPMHLREAIYSLGGSRLVSSYILLRYVRASILAGIGIGVGKAMSETAPLLFTAFGSEYYPSGGLEALLKPIGALTLGIYTMALSGYSNWVEASWGAAFILLAISIALFTAIRIISGRR
ncbi:MAG: hypothetical protein QXE01_02240 [Sulfolobales archaeon]